MLNNMAETKTWKEEATDSINSGFFDDENEWGWLAYDFAISIEDCKEGTFEEAYNFIETKRQERKQP